MSVGRSTRANAAAESAGSYVVVGPRQGGDMGGDRDEPGDARFVLDPLQMKVARAASFLGGKAELARYVGVSRSQPGRWMEASEFPSPESRRLVQDLEYVVSRLEGLWEERTARTWLGSPNAFLDGARPMDVLRDEGPAPVIAALDAAAAGSYA